MENREKTKSVCACHRKIKKILCHKMNKTDEKQTVTNQKKMLLSGEI